MSYLAKHIIPMLFRDMIPMFFSGYDPGALTGYYPNVFFGTPEKEQPSLVQVNGSRCK